MKNFFRALKRFLNILYKILPFCIGMYCYYPVFLEKDCIYPFLDTVYASFKLYSGSTVDGVPINALLEVARFMALIATLSILVDAVNKMNDVANWFKLLVPGVSVVYGDSSYADSVWESLNPRRRIRGERKFIAHASRYILMFSNDTENLEFYHRHYEQLKDKNVYIMLEDISRQNIENPLISIFSIAENCARQYWKNYPVEKSEKIAVIGFESVGENILLYGLQMNLIDPEQQFVYHIYGDGSSFRRQHTELAHMAPDQIVFHDDGTYFPGELQDFDRVILCGSQNDGCNISAVSRLLVSLPFDCPIYIYAPNGDIVTNLFGRGRVTCFGTAQECASADIIFNERFIEAARKQHEFYFKKYGGVPWEKLNAFKRYSNVSSSDYTCVIERLMRQGVSLEKIAELEHIRWCRYHYIHNWKYAPERDDGKRLHNCLVPFADLSEEEKLKDMEAIKSKISG